MKATHTENIICGDWSMYLLYSLSKSDHYSIYGIVAIALINGVRVTLSNVGAMLWRVPITSSR